MVSDYQEWVFRSDMERSVEETQAWREQCYLPSSVDRMLPDSAYWYVVAGCAGSGKTVALQAIPQWEAQRGLSPSFLIPYPTDYWPGSKKAWLKQEKNHLAQMMACASIRLRDHLSHYPLQLEQFSDLQREFTRWLLERAGGERIFRGWVAAMPANLRAIFQDTPQINLYPTVEDPLDVQGQIFDLVSLVRVLGFRQLLFVVDIDSSLDEPQLPLLGDLFGWLDLAHQAGFSLIAAVPLSLLPEVKQRSRGRATVSILQWSLQQCQTIATQHLRLATNNRTLLLTDYAESALLEKAGQWLREQYQQDVPASWVQLTQTLLNLTHHSLPSLPHPLTLQQWDQLRYSFSANHLKLKLDLAKHGVWLGPRFVKLDDQPFSLLQLLYRRRGHPISWEDRELRDIVGSQPNLHSIASRLRKAIEPVPRDPVYLFNDRAAGGYSLENYL